jgi:hypothetical protein
MWYKFEKNRLRIEFAFTKKQKRVGNITYFDCCLIDLLFPVVRHVFSG